nr:putative ribonuclease H-like domain-containing protein [Tanacetum cinerariifolium]
GNSQNNIDDKGYWDSGCSRHMTGNISYLSEYEPYDGGYVSFGHGGGKITGKDIIKTGKLEFENVYFVKELKYNLFSVSQICDNKNSVMFTNSECLVLGKDFMLNDDTNVLLRTPKQHNMYSIDLNNNVPHKNLTCLVEKASVDEIKHSGYLTRELRKYENLHVDFLENKLIEKGAGPNWLFDIDTLTNSMNYVPVVVAGTSSTNISGTKDVASKAVKKDVSFLRYIALPNWFHEAHIETSNDTIRNNDAKDDSQTEQDCNADVPENSEIFNPTATSKVPSADQVEPAVSLTVESDILTVSSYVPTVCLDISPESSSGPRLISKGPPGFQDSEFLERVYKVEKAMYGLHQAPRAWYGTLSKYLLDNGFQRGTIDQTLFIRKHKEEFLLVQVYVDDIIFGSSNPQLCREFKALMHDKFQINAMSELTFFFGLHVLQKKDGISSYKTSMLVIFSRSLDTQMLEHNTDFHQIVDFLEASHIRNALTISPTIYVSHIRQFWSTARIETTDQETKIIATVDAPTETLTARRLTKRAIRIAQSKALSPDANEPASLSRDDRQEEAFPTVSSLDAGLKRQQSLMADKIKDQDIEISGLKARVKSLEDKEKRHEEPIQEDAPIIGGIVDIWEELGADKSTEKGSNDTEEMVNVLSSMEAANILSSGGATASVSPVDVFSIAGVPTVSGSFPIEQIDAQVAREMEEEFPRENQRLSEQVARDSEITRIHAEEELKLMIEGLDRSNEVIAKHLSEYEQAEADLSVEEKIELISELVKYQDHRAKILTWKQWEDFVPMSSKEESERVKKPGLKGSKGVSEEELKGMMQLVPLEEVYIEALQSTRDKEKELWVELKRLFEPDSEDQLWTYNQAFMHDPLDWKLYDTCGVHHVSTKNQEIFMTPWPIKGVLRSE